MDKRPVMKCGHTANAETMPDHKPCCAICECYEVAEEQDLKLEGRKAKCFYCNKTVDSDTQLPFFEHKPDKEFDGYYCGCRGWD